MAWRHANFTTQVLLPYILINKLIKLEDFLVKNIAFNKDVNTQLVDNKDG